MKKKWTLRGCFSEKTKDFSVEHNDSHSQIISRIWIRGVFGNKYNYGTFGTESFGSIQVDFQSGAGTITAAASGYEKEIISSSSNKAKMKRKEVPHDISLNV